MGIVSTATAIRAGLPSPAASLPEARNGLRLMLGDTSSDPDDPGCSETALAALSRDIPSASADNRNGALQSSSGPQIRYFCSPVPETAGSSCT